MPNQNFSQAMPNLSPSLTIKFEEDYLKLHGQHRGFLLYVQVVDYDDLSEEFLIYDTTKVSGSRYHLPSGQQYIRLVFLGEKGIPFTTVRRMDYSKHGYYREHTKEWFELVIGGSQT